MRNYNHELINTQYALIEAFLFQADKDVLDISYSVYKNKIIIQIVLLEGFVIPKERKENTIKKLSGFEVLFNAIYLTKKQFNENKGEWQPKYYKWLDFLLFSKSEVL